MEKPGKRKGQKAVIFKTDSPYTSPQWPPLDSTEQENFLNLLSHLLAPIGYHRKAYITPSKGRRNKKRRRVEEKVTIQSNGETSASSQMEVEISSPSAPEIRQYVTIGLNSTSRALESIISRIAPKKSTNPSNPTAERSADRSRRFAAIFLTAATQNYLPYSHIPTLTALASAVHPNMPPIRLIQLGAASEKKLCEALGLQRVGIVAIQDEAPGADPLIDYVRDNVEAVDVAWTREVGAGQWLGTSISMGKTREENGI